MTFLLEKNLNLAELYDQDYCLWIENTVELLRLGELSKLDIPNLIEEIEDMSKKEKKALESNLEILLMHLLKYKYQPQKITNSWKFTIREHRNRIKKAFKYSPSLKRLFENVFEESYQQARKFTADETGLSIETFPQQCCFSLEEILDENYLPKNDS
jgi:hypothetical protein